MPAIAANPVLDYALAIMRLKSDVFVQAYMRIAAAGGAAAMLVRRGDADAGAIFIRINRLDGHRRPLWSGTGGTRGRRIGQAVRSVLCGGWSDGSTGRRLPGASAGGRSGPVGRRSGGSGRSPLSRRLVGAGMSHFHPNFPQSSARAIPVNELLGWDDVRLIPAKPACAIAGIGGYEQASDDIAMRGKPWQRYWNSDKA